MRDGKDTRGNSSADTADEGGRSGVSCCGCFTVVDDVGMEICVICFKGDVCVIPLHGSYQPSIFVDARFRAPAQEYR